jgi:hypothetical protein
MYVGAQCIEEETTKFLALLREFRDVFAQSYTDLLGFYPMIIHHLILIGKDPKMVTQR